MIWELLCFFLSCFVCVVLSSACCSSFSISALSLPLPGFLSFPVFHAVRQRCPPSSSRSARRNSRATSSSSRSSSSSSSHSAAPAVSPHPSSGSKLSTDANTMTTAAASNDPLQKPLPPTICRPSSPSPDTVPTPAIGGLGSGSAGNNSLGAGLGGTDGQNGRNSGSHELSRCLSTASSMSHGSATTDAESSFSRQSSGAYSTLSTSSSRLSLASFDRASTGGASTHHPKRRGYMRPQGTNFAASARSRESVLSLGSIAHLQHYFARTGLLDLKGNLERKRQSKARTLDLTQLDASSLSVRMPSRSVSMTSMHSSFMGSNRVVSGTASIASGASASDVDSSYASIGSSPDLGATSSTTPDSSVLVESPIREEYPGEEDDDEEWSVDDLEEPDPSVLLPPTVSTYMLREKPLPKPPSVAELKADLRSSLGSAAKALAQARETKQEFAKSKPVTASPGKDKSSVGTSATNGSPRSPRRPATPTGSPQWFEIQGMHILDVMTLAIRAAKMYYTSHEDPDTLDAIKPEREVRSELLGVMDVLKRMAARTFAGGIRDEEMQAMDSWITSLNTMLDTEDAMAAAVRKERANWTWLRDEDWPAVDTGAGKSSNRLAQYTDPTDRERACAREHAFLQSMMAGDSSDLPAWTPMDRSVQSLDDADKPPEGTPPTGPPTPFLKHMQNGVQLVQLHNCAVRKSRRRFGAIPSFHADTQKPYRAAENLRYWFKAAELRWEAPLVKIDALAVVCNSQRTQVWADFEDAIWQWCRIVRAEIASEVMASEAAATAKATAAAKATTTASE